MLAGTYGRLRSGWEVPVPSMCLSLGLRVLGLRSIETASHSMCASLGKWWLPWPDPHRLIHGL